MGSLVITPTDTDIFIAHKKLYSSLRYWLLGKEYHNASRALNFAAKWHNKVRKDGKTPEFDHQLRICHYIRTLPKLLYPEETITTGLLHDVVEDYDVTINQIADLFADRAFAMRVSHSTWLVTKKKDGEGKSAQFYYGEMSSDPIASIVKGADRGHNFQTMVEVFTLEKQREYIAEAEAYILPMLKRARRLFPEQEPAYENIKHVLVSQIELIRHIHAAAAAANRQPRQAVRRPAKKAK